MTDPVKGLLDIEKKNRYVMPFVEVVSKIFCHTKKVVVRTMCLTKTVLKVRENLFRFSER